MKVGKQTHLSFRFSVGLEGAERQAWSVLLLGNLEKVRFKFILLKPSFHSIPSIHFHGRGKDHENVERTFALFKIGLMQ